MFMFMLMLFFLGLLLDWLGQTLLFSHWSTHSECSTYSEFVAVAVAVEGMPSPHHRWCREDGHGQPSSPSLSRRWPALIAVTVEGMASPHGRRSQGDRHASREWTSQQVLTETHCAVPPIRSDFPDYGPNSDFFLGNWSGFDPDLVWKFWSFVKIIVSTSSEAP